MSTNAELFFIKLWFVLLPFILTWTIISLDSEIFSCIFEGPTYVPFIIEVPQNIKIVWDFNLILFPNFQLLRFLRL